MSTAVAALLAPGWRAQVKAGGPYARRAAMMLERCERAHRRATRASRVRVVALPMLEGPASGYFEAAEPRGELTIVIADHGDEANATTEQRVMRLAVSAGHLDADAMITRRITLGRRREGAASWSWRDVERFFGGHAPGAQERAPFEAATLGRGEVTPRNASAPEGLRCAKTGMVPAHAYRVEVVPSLDGRKVYFGDPVGGVLTLLIAADQPRYPYPGSKAERRAARLARRFGRLSAEAKPVGRVVVPYTLHALEDFQLSQPRGASGTRTTKGHQ